MPFYKIRPGFTFREVDGSIKAFGDIVELGQDVAINHREKIDFVSMGAPAETVQTSVPAEAEPAPAEAEPAPAADQA